MTKIFWKSTIVIYSPYDPAGLELSDLAREAEVGDCYCSEHTVELTKAKDDPLFPMEFFDFGEDA